MGPIPWTVFVKFTRLPQGQDEVEADVRAGFDEYAIVNAIIVKVHRYGPGAKGGLKSDRGRCGFIFRGSVPSQPKIGTGRFERASSGCRQERCAQPAWAGTRETR